MTYGGKEDDREMEVGKERRLGRYDGNRMQEKGYCGLWADMFSRLLQVLLGEYLRLRYVSLVLTRPVLFVPGKAGIDWLEFGLLLL